MNPIDQLKVTEDDSATARCSAILWLLLNFAERNPGFSRLFAGDVLQGV